METAYLTIEDLCKELHIGKSTAYKLCKTKTIKSVSIGRRILIPRKSIDTYIQSMLQEE